MPSSVFGPVLSPPWSLQRPFGMAGHWQGVPRRFFAPHPFALKKSPGGLPFRSDPLRWLWGVSSIVVIIPRPPAMQSPFTGFTYLRPLFFSKSFTYYVCPAVVQQ